MIKVILLLTTLQPSAMPTQSQDTPGSASVQIIRAARITAEAFENTSKEQRTYLIGHEDGQLVEYRLIEFE